MRGGIILSEFGYKIKNYEAASIVECNLGLRNKPDEENAMLSNSLFKDFLVENGLNVWKEESTRDIICVMFGYGTKDLRFYKEKLKVPEEKLAPLMETYKRTSREELRKQFYVNGFDFTYKKYDKKTESYVPDETIHYKMLYRTPGKAKKGTCMFINEKLYDKAREFLYMGIKLPEKNAPIVEIGAYSSLITSSIVGTIKIEPNEILVVEDFDSYFNTDIVSVELDDNGHCRAVRKKNQTVKNTMFDGQALIDYSIFPEWGNGYVLLRQHFTKCAAFKTDIQGFMRDHFGDSYETATITDMFGREVRVKDIKLITTDNALKWLKFKDITFDYWAEWVKKNGSLWGVVKTAHESKLGGVQRMSYQMNNALDVSSMDSIVKESVDYINKLKSDNEVFFEYLRNNQNFSNDFEVLLALVEHNPDFVNCDYFRERKKHIIYAYTIGVKSGHTIQNGDNLTIVGSPYAMLLHSVGLDPLSDPTFKVEDGCIQCWTSRFNDGEYLAEFRNPFNSRNNMGYVHNVYHEYFDKYFDLGDLIIAVNMNGTNFQDRNNGSDQDSDSCYTTNQKEIVEHAKYCHSNYPTIVNNIPKEKNIYSSSLEDFAKVDCNLASAQLAIGESSNVAQLALTYTYNFNEQKYDDAVCILSVLA